MKGVILRVINRESKKLKMDRWDEIREGVCSLARNEE